MELQVECFRTYTSSTLSFSSATVGNDELSFVSASWKSVGSWTFCKAERSGMGICGTLMSSNGLTLLIASMAVRIAEFAF